MSGQWNDIVCKTIIVTLTTCWLWRVMSKLMAATRSIIRKISLNVDLKILILKRERGADGVWIVENKTRSSRCLNVQRESWVVVTPPPPPHVQVMVPHVPHYLQLTLAICRAQTRCMMGHLTTLILSTYPQTPQLSVSLCGVWDILRTEMSLTCYTVFWVVCGNKYFITRQTFDNVET